MALRRGQQLYLAFRCVECHGPRGEGDFGPPLPGTDVTFAIFREQMRGGIGWYMPAYSEDELNDSQLRDIFAWLGSLHLAAASR